MYASFTLNLNLYLVPEDTVENTNMKCLLLNLRSLEVGVEDDVCDNETSVTCNCKNIYESYKYLIVWMTNNIVRGYDYIYLLNEKNEKIKSSEF